jgi:hypothetical protein
MNRPLASARLFTSKQYLANASGLLSVQEASIALGRCFRTTDLSDSPKKGAIRLCASHRVMFIVGKTCHRGIYSAADEVTLASVFNDYARSVSH